MSVASLLPVFLVGLLGSVHCVGMCGGIVGAFSLTTPAVKPFPLPVVAASGATATGRLAEWPATLGRVAAYNLGRISSYAVAGAVAGGLVRSVLLFANIASLQWAAYAAANLMLILLGLYLMGAWSGLAQLELLGRGLWQRVMPLTKKLLPLDRPMKLVLAGALWGWLPCGMVYSMLFTALLSGSAASGAAVMVAFGLGTLPTLLAMGMFGAALRNWTQRRSVRILCGAIVLAYGVLGLVHASHQSHGLQATWLDTLCVSPAGGGGQ